MRFRLVVHMCSRSGAACFLTTGPPRVYESGVRPSRSSPFSGRVRRGRDNGRDRSTVKHWRGRFSELDRWFQANRPFILWDQARSCIRIDQEAKQNAAPTGRKSRRSPELKPPW